MNTRFPTTSHAPHHIHGLFPERIVRRRLVQHDPDVNPTDGEVESTEKEKPYVFSNKGGPQNQGGW